MGASVQAEGVGPVVGGYWKLAESGKISQAVLGQVLLGELNCTACHRTVGAGAVGEGVVLTKGCADLKEVGRRVTPQYLRAFLDKPHEVKAGTSMPDVLAGMEAGERAAAAEALTHFLASLGGPVRVGESAGNAVIVERGKKLYNKVGCLACHGPQTPMPEKPGEKPLELKSPSVPLGKLGMKTSVVELADFLIDPIKARPASRMPASGLTPVEARDIAVYLLRDQVPATQPSTRPTTRKSVAGTSQPATRPGAKLIAYTVYEAKLTAVPLEAFEKFKVKSEGRADHFGVEIAGKQDGRVCGEVRDGAGGF